MRTIVGIPVLYNGSTCLKAFKSVIGEADLLIVDNNSEKDVKQAIREIWHEHANVKVIQNAENLYVTEAWNQSLKYFLESNYDQLVIMNSDLILEQGWSSYLVDGVSCIPTDGSHKEDEVVYSGTQGIFIHLNKKMAELIYPIPNEIKLWFGDDFAFTVLREFGYKTIVRSGIVANHFHGGSQSIAILPNKSEMIEDDKIAWKDIVEPLMWERINQLKANKN